MEVYCNLLPILYGKTRVIIELFQYIAEYKICYPYNQGNVGNKSRIL